MIATRSEFGGGATLATNGTGTFVTAARGRSGVNTSEILTQSFGTEGLIYTTGDGITDSTITVRGTQAQLNGLLDGMIYTPNPGFNGVDTLTITTDDLGNTGSGGALQDIDNVLITVGNPNAPAVNLDADDSSGAGGNDFAAAWTEGAGPVLVADADAHARRLGREPDGPDGHAHEPARRTDELLIADTSGTSIAASYDSATGVLTLSGADTAANYQQVLRTIAYDNTSEAPDATTRVITFTATDAISNGNTATATLTIAAQNDAPVNTVPAAQATAQEHRPDVLDRGGNAISVDDADAGDAPVEITLSVTDGTLTLDDTGRVGVETQLNTTTAQQQMNVRFGTADDGSTVAVWQRSVPGRRWLGGVRPALRRGRHRVGGEIQINTTTAADQTGPILRSRATVRS